MKWYRSFECCGKEGELSVEANDEFEAESELDHEMEGYLQGYPERRESFEFTSGVYSK